MQASRAVSPPGSETDILKEVSTDIFKTVLLWILTKESQSGRFWQLTTTQ